MKPGIHPTLHTVNVECVCGATFNTKSTVELNKVDICSSCHPFYSGKQKVVDTEGRIEKFNKKFGGAYAERLAKAKAKKK